MSDHEIVTVAIHPAIGIARVGNSESGCFFASECPGDAAGGGSSFRDRTGALKRQGARFRIYGFNREGQAVRELTSDDAEIRWTVQLANKKAAWYRFDTPLDVPSAAPATRRNADIPLDKRDGLVVRPSAKRIAGANKAGRQYRFDDGTFLGIPVPLGELRTDAKGRLIVLGGHGRTYTPEPWKVPNSTTNNDRWCDDTSDGMVSATVKLRDGRAMVPYPSWVIVAPPNFAPELFGFVTLFDVVESVTSDWNAATQAPVSFAADIFPLFERLVNLQWVNRGFLHEFGWLALQQLLVPDIVARLADKTDAARPLRTLVFNKFRNPDYPSAEPQAIPAIYGDVVSRFPPFDVRQWMSVTPLQYQRLRQWSEGSFQSTLPVRPVAACSLSSVPIAEQPRALDRAALDGCSGGPFHPGIEATWPMRQQSLYVSPFRFRVSAGGTTRDFGDQLTPEAALAEDGPLCAAAPGDVTKWLAVPWHTDTMTCRAGYDLSFDANLPTFWPTRVPNHVLTEDAFATIDNPSAPINARLEAFASREDWLRHLDDPNVQESFRRIIDEWPTLGLVLRRRLSTPVPGLPSELYVETGNRSKRTPAARPHIHKWTFDL